MGNPCCPEFYPSNVEGLTEYDIGPGWCEGRKPGFSAMIRLKDDAEWIEKSVESVYGGFDEIVICLQGDQTDGTDEIVRGLPDPQDKIRVYEFPFDSIPNGPGHDQQARGSVHERAYFYNWCLSKTTRKIVSKWDGDMVAFDWLLDTVRRDMKGTNAVSFKGWDIVGPRKRHVSLRKRHTANEVRFWRVTPDTYFYTGKYCEVLRKPSPVLEWPQVGYLHFKWAKDFRSATKAWPSGWEKHEHFRRIYARYVDKRSMTLYNGEVPTCLIQTI